MIKSIFAPTEVAASLALIVLVITFTLVYFGARHRPSGATHSSVAVSQASPAPDVSPSASADRSPVAHPATDNGLGTVIRAALATTTHRRGSGGPTPSAPPSPTDAASPSPSDAATPTPSPIDIPTPTPSPIDIPTPTPSPIDIPTPSPSPS